MTSRLSLPRFAPVFRRRTATGSFSLVMFNSQGLDDSVRPAHPHGRRIEVEVPAPMLLESRLPDREANARLDHQAEALMAKLTSAKIAFVYPGRYTGDGVRVHLFQVVEPDAFDAAMRPWATAQPWRTTVDTTPGWEFVDKMIKPTPDELDEVDNLNILGALRAARSDLTKPHTLDHVFTGPAEALDRLAPLLAQQGLAVARPGQDLIAAETRMLDAEEINARTRQFRKLAELQGAGYDGWGAAVKRKPWWWPF